MTVWDDRGLNGKRKEKQNALGGPSVRSLWTLEDLVLLSEKVSN